MKARHAIILVLLLVLGAGSAFGAGGKLEFGLALGGDFGAAKTASGYSRAWSAEFLQHVNESTTISIAERTGFLAALDLTYYFAPDLGVRLSAAVLTTDPRVASYWTADFNYEGYNTISHQGTFFPGSARLTSVPLSLDLVGRFRLGWIKAFAQAGPTLFLNNFLAAADSVYGQTVFNGSYPQEGEQWTDFFDIPLHIPKAHWTAVGADIGAGFEVRISKPLVVTFGGRYYLCPAKDFTWQWVPGMYSSFVYQYSNFTNVVFTDFAAEQGLTTKLRIKPSFFALTAGIRLVL